MYNVEYNICQISFNGNFTQKITNTKKDIQETNNKISWKGEYFRYAAALAEQNKFCFATI